MSRQLERCKRLGTNLSYNDSWEWSITSPSLLKISQMFRSPYESCYRKTSSGTGMTKHEHAFTEIRVTDEQLLQYYCEETRDIVCRFFIIWSRCMPALGWTTCLILLTITEPLRKQPCTNREGAFSNRLRM